MTLKIITFLTTLYDKISCFWESPTTQKRNSIIILCIFIADLIVIELNRESLLPQKMAHSIPTNHFRAISLAFTLILCVELVELVFSISHSLSKAVGKQLEIMSLILLRNAFKELSILPEPVSLMNGTKPLLTIGLAGLTSLSLFVCLGIYTNMEKCTKDIPIPEERMRYIASKKIISLILLCIFIMVTLRDLYFYYALNRKVAFFETVYTILIFADIFIVLVGHRFMHTFNSIFLHSASVVATLVMRLSLSAPLPWDMLAAISAGFYILAVTWATQHFSHKVNTC